MVSKTKRPFFFIYKTKKIRFKQKITIPVVYDDHMQFIFHYF